MDTTCTAQVQMPRWNSILRIENRRGQLAPRRCDIAQMSPTCAQKMAAGITQTPRHEKPRGPKYYIYIYTYIYMWTVYLYIILYIYI